MSHCPLASHQCPLAAGQPAAPGGHYAPLRVSRPGARHAATGDRYFVCVEIERFGDLRRSLGYALANRLIDRICAAIAHTLPGSEVGRAGRTSLDFIFAAASEVEARVLLMSLGAATAQAAIADGFHFDLPLTMGVAPIGGGQITEGAIDLAEAALAQARKRHLRLLFADPTADNPVANRLALIGDLQRAIAEDGLELHYQPKLRARSGGIDTVEALIRWPHPTRGTIMPDDFVPLAEETGDVRALTQWIIQRALRDQTEVQAAGHALRLDVNISGALVADPDFAAWVIASLGDAAGRIGFEITETAMITDPDRALANLTTFAEMGIRLAIDDYGSGFSSLSYLQRLPVHELKLDKSFVSKIAATARDPLLVRSTIDLAHALDMEVTAEGVDTPEALALLQVMGCDLLQGYLIARPMPLAALVDFLDRAGQEDSISALHDMTARRRLGGR